MNRHLIPFFVLIPCSILGFACGVTDVVGAHVDCHSVCNRYSDCFDKSYDIDGCEQRCNDRADGESAYQDHLDACDDCMDDAACATASFECATQCTNIVP